MTRLLLAADLLQAMGEMTDDGSSLIEAWTQLKETTTDPTLQQFLNELISDWNAGLGFEGTFERHPELYPKFVVASNAAAWVGQIWPQVWPDAAKVMRLEDEFPLTSVEAYNVQRNRFIFYARLGFLLQYGVTADAALEALVADNTAVSWQSGLEDLRSQLKGGAALLTALNSSSNLLNPADNRAFDEALRAGPDETINGESKLAQFWNAQKPTTKK